MSATAEKPEGAGLWAWLAHRWWMMLALLVVAESGYVVARFLGSDFGRHFTPGAVLYIAVVLGVIIGQIPVDRHFSRLCAECVTRIPVDGERRAERRARPLYWFHHMHARPWRPMTYYLGYLVGVVLLGQVGLWEKSGPVATLFTSIGFLAMVVGLEALALVHRPLVPWCPFCRWGRDDDGPREVVPDPVPPSRAPDRVT